MEWTRRTIAVTVVAVLLATVLFGLVGAAVYFEVGYGPDEAAVEGVEANDSVTVARVDAGTVVRSGPSTARTVGLVYYPGARVNHESYVPTAAGIVADRNVVVLIVDMPLNLAVLAPGRADAAADAAPAVESWYVGGHSLGGAMACRYAAGNAAAIEGLVLHAAYCDEEITGTDLRVLSVLGADDAVIDAETERGSRDLLPADTTIVELDGVTHSGFGAYGTQRGEGRPPREPAAMRVDVARVTGRWLVGDASRNTARASVPTTNVTRIIGPRRPRPRCRRSRHAPGDRAAPR